MTTQNAQALRIERLPAVCERIGVAKSTIYRWIDEGRFPPPVRIGPHAVGWPASSVDDFILEVISKAEKESAALAWA